ncbi:MAG: tryptophan synthase subunit alpha [Synergistaceae bacterium]|nr:tryptophan synthase subunit alpha [Synergistaceae bacterium]
MSKIREAFSGGKAFIPFITCGDPDITTTKRVIHEAVRNGADIIELGIPFSDPTAEGEVIQSANYRALKNGVTTDKIFDMVRDLRRDINIPLVFMTYANVVFSYGSEKFISTCRDIEIDGLILPDVPFEEKDEFLPFCKSYGVDLVSMVAPTSEDRIAMISREAEGFLYVVSSLGVTGVRERITTDLAAIVGAARKNSDVPCAIGFGISTPEQARKMSEIADGVIVGSAVMRIIARYGNESPRYVGEYVKSMQDAIRKF